MRRGIGLLAMVATLSVDAAGLTGHDVMRMCTTDQDACYWYLAGVHDTYQAMHARAEITPTICMGDEVTPDALSRAFQSYLNDRLQQWHFDAGALALNAFQKAWPCAR